MSVWVSASMGETLRGPGRDPKSCEHRVNPGWRTDAAAPADGTDAATRGCGQSTTEWADPSGIATIATRERDVAHPPRDADRAQAPPPDRTSRSQRHQPDPSHDAAHRHRPAASHEQRPLPLAV